MALFEARDTSTYKSNISSTFPSVQLQAESSKTLGDSKEIGRVLKLPSEIYQYSVWHDLKHTEVKGSELRAPRVRCGPDDGTFYTTNDAAQDDIPQPIHHNRTGTELVSYRDKQENWEDSIRVNLSHQDLNSTYQRQNFMRILRRLKTAEVIVLTDNCLDDLSSITFQKCRVIDLSNNYFSSFKKLPSMPVVKEIILTHNQIQSTHGLRRFPYLEMLQVQGNSITYCLDYRQRIFREALSLRILDGTIKLQSDTEPFEMPFAAPEAKTCVIS